MSDHEHQLLSLLARHTCLGNGKARELLGWDQATYERVEQALVAGGQVANKPEAVSPKADEPNKPVTQNSREAERPLGQKAQANKPKAKSSWKS